MRGLLYNNDEEVAAWAFKTYNFRPSKFDKAIGIVDPETLHQVGAVLFQGYNGTNVEVSYYGRNTMTPGIIRMIASEVILFFEATRLTAVTSKRNKRFIRGLLRLGFALEGHMRCYYGAHDCPRNTGVRLVMFRPRLEQIARYHQSKVA